MAKFILLGESVPNWFYALDECEDYLVLDAYDVIKASHKFDPKPALQKFEYFHLDIGSLLADDVLMALNGFLRILGRDPIALVNGHSTPHSVMRDHPKILRRASMLDEIRSLPVGHRALFIDGKRQQAATLPERNYTEPAPSAAAHLLQRHEVERRRAALAQAQRIELGTAQAEKRQTLTLAKAPETLAIKALNEAIREGCEARGIEAVEDAEPVHLAEPAPEPITTSAPAVKVGYNKVRISLDTLSAMRQRVAAAAPKVAPEPDSLNIRQAVAAMYDDLADAHGRGVTWEQLAAELSDLGVKLSAGTLHTYFGDEKRSRGHTRPRKASA